MKVYGLLTGGLGLLLLTSCSSVRKLSDKDSRVSTTMTKKQKGNAPREFLDMEVTPGGQAAGQQAKVAVNRSGATPVKHTAVTTTVSHPVATGAGTSTNIENAHSLQLKYAVAMDVTVEMLTNIALLQVIDRWWGTKYCLGGNTDSCIDCSGFTLALMRDVYQQTLPRTAEEQFNAAEKVALEDLREGDLVFFNTSGRDISHVGVYLLNNKFVHAATSGGVMISDLNDVYWQPRYRGAGRVSTKYEVRGTK
jgi:cell wall-associated NlpC family hydrolase